MVTWIAEFRLSITRALADQLATTLEPLTPVTLTQATLNMVEARPGVYVLFIDGERVYVGKAAASLRARLDQHHRKLSGRSGIALKRVQFACVYVDEDLDAAAPEKLLIKKYRESGTIPWNTNGFGNKDPGRNRDKSLVKAKHFDALFPIDLSYHLNLRVTGWSAADLLERLKRDLPYLLRYDTTTANRALLKRARVELPDGKVTAREALASIIAALPSGWQATALPGYVILYKEDTSYDSALLRWHREVDGTIRETQGPQRFDAGDVDPGEPADLFS
ncbi:GIY-YIG nuclease family protein [Actinoplanes sp. NPDC089786]|uniref:GIY-YIG nuclease family protein n=1 Tax=Actinoplanes sp. NPDC089786 TaxID=3155185 RepID=UPI003414A9EA